MADPAAPALIDLALLDHLARYDTPTICNALEVATGGRRATGFTREQMVSAFPSLPPIVGFARTATLRASAPSSMSAAEQREMRLAYYEYVASGGVPTIDVIQDLDDQPGVGAFWGEVNSKVHAGLGLRGAITNGALRDLDVLSTAFQILAGKVTPSHAFVRIESIRTRVDIFGMEVTPGDLIPADRHGAVVVPIEAAPRLPAAIGTVIKREKLILDAAARPGFSVADIRKALSEGDDIH